MRKQTGVFCEFPGPRQYGSEKSCLLSLEAKEDVAHFIDACVVSEYLTCFSKMSCAPLFFPGHTIG